MTAITAVPALVLPAPFPTTADRIAGTYNAKAKTWADGESAMASNQHAIATATHQNATAAEERAASAEATRALAVSQTQAIKDAAVSDTNAIKADAQTAANSAAASLTAAQGVANYKGQWSTLSGALNTPASVWHQGRYWGLLSNLANVATAQPGVHASWAAVGSPVHRLAYDDRATLRTLATPGLEWALVDGLGLFAFEAGSTEPDDDESCFASATGCWLLQCPSWDLVDAWQQPAQEQLEGRILAGAADCAITSVAAGVQVSFTASLPGAAVGDVAVASPPDALDARLSVFARVTALHQVTVYLNNPSASTAALSAGLWRLTVIKEN